MAGNETLLFEQFQQFQQQTRPTPRLPRLRLADRHRRPRSQLLRGETMTAPAWPPGLRPPDNVTHSWRCSRPLLEDRYLADPKTGEPRVEKRCPSCGGVERPPRSTP
jgi:hypothetical protein